MNEVLEQLALVNGIGELEARELLDAHWRIFEERSRRDWLTDMGALSRLGVERPFFEFVFASAATTYCLTLVAV